MRIHPCRHCKPFRCPVQKNNNKTAKNDVTLDHFHLMVKYEDGFVDNVTQYRMMDEDVSI